MEVFRCAACGSFNRIRDPGGRVPICGHCKAHLDTSGAPQEVSEAGLEEAIRSSPLPVLVDFWAPWCGPGRTAGPVLEAIARSNAGRLVVLKINTDQNQGAATRHGVQGIPLFVMFRDGYETARQTGLPPRPSFERWITAHAA